MGLVLGACGGSGSEQNSSGSSLKAADVKSCLERTLQPGTWAELPISSQGAPVFAVDLGGNSVQIFIEKNAVAVTAESASIRTEENAIGNVEAAHRVILHPKGNVLVSWANEPSADQKAVVERCAGFS